MQHKSTIRAGRRLTRIVCIAIGLSTLLLASQAFGQQTYVGRWDLFGGYMSLNQPYLNLSENGFHLQAGMRLTTWLSGGFDYSVGAGNTVLTPDMLRGALQRQLGGALSQMTQAGLIPPGYKLAVPTDTFTQSFTIGPQLAYRHFQAVTFFVRPNVGALQAVATTHPRDPIATGLIRQLAPTGKKEDWSYYYGFGGGFEFNVTKHFALRVQADLVHNYMFNDLVHSTNVVRFSIGPGFQWGRNMVE